MVTLHLDPRRVYKRAIYRPQRLAGQIDSHWPRVGSGHPCRPCRLGCSRITLPPTARPPAAESSPCPSPLGSRLDPCWGACSLGPHSEQVQGLRDLCPRTHLTRCGCCAGAVGVGMCTHTAWLSWGPSQEMHVLLGRRSCRVCLEPVTLPPGGNGCKRPAGLLAAGRSSPQWPGQSLLSVCIFYLKACG